MARISTPGIWLPGPLNAINSSSESSQADIAGNPYWMGLNAGKMVVLGTNEAQDKAAQDTTLYDGSYQYVQLDSGATAAYATEGFAAYILLNQGQAQGTLPEAPFATPVVTTGDVAHALGLDNMFCGVFINPATLVATNDNVPTPGNWTMIFVGGGRVTVQVGAVADVAVGNAVYPDTGYVGKFEGNAAPTTTPRKSGLGLTVGTSGNTAVVYYSDIIFRFAD